MGSGMKPMVAGVAFSACVLAATPGVRPGTPQDRLVTAVTESGQIYVAAREVPVDVDFPSGRSGKGKLFVVFDPSTHLFLQTFNWETGDYPRIFWIDNIESLSRIGVTSDRLVVVGFAYGIGISESTERAASLDDAETRSLQWITAHFPDVEAKSKKYATVTSHLVIGPAEFPRGFLRGYDSMPLQAVRLVDMGWLKGGWNLTLENKETHQKAMFMIFRHGDMWVLKK